MRVREQGYLKGGDISSAVVMVGLMSERKLYLKALLSAFFSVGANCAVCYLILSVFEIKVTREVTQTKKGVSDKSLTP